MYYKAKITYRSINNKGKAVTTTEFHLVRAYTFTEAEAALYTLAEGRTDFSVKRIDPYKLTDLYLTDGITDLYKCKVVYQTETAKGKPKKINNIMLISATSVTDAHQRLNQELKTMLVPYDIDDVEKTDLLEVLQPQVAHQD